MKISSVKLCESHLAKSCNAIDALLHIFFRVLFFVARSIWHVQRRGRAHVAHISILNSWLVRLVPQSVEVLWIRWIRWIWGWRIFHATVAKFGDPCRKSIPCAIQIDTGSRPPSSICQVRVVGGRYGQIDCKGEMIEDASACDHYDHRFYHILPLNSRWVSLSIE